MATPTYKRHTSDSAGTKSLEALTKAEKLAVHTIKICANEKIFLPQYWDALTNDIIGTAKDIFVAAWDANNIYVNNDPIKWNRRKALQERSVGLCNRMLALILIGRQTFKLRGKKVHYWSELTVDTRNLIRAWMEADRRRYGDLDRT